MDGDVCAGPAKAKRAKPAASRVMWTAHKHKGNNKVKTTEVTIQQHTHTLMRGRRRAHTHPNAHKCPGAVAVHKVFGDDVHRVMDSRPKTNKDQRGSRDTRNNGLGKNTNHYAKKFSPNCRPRLGAGPESSTKHAHFSTCP